jgi:ATP-binding cassette subfamily C protein
VSAGGPLARGASAAWAVAPVVVLLNALQALFGLALPLFLMAVFDRVLGTRSPATLAWLFAGLAVALVALAVADFVRTLALHWAGQALARRIADPAFRAACRAGGAVQPLRDVEALRSVAASPTLGTALDMLWMPAFLVALAFLGTAFALYGAAAAALLLVLHLGLARASRAGLIAANDAAAASGGEVVAAARCAEAVTGLGMLGPLASRWRQRQVEALALAARAVRRLRVTDALTRTLRLGAGGGMVALGAVLVIRGEATPGAMIAANLILARLLAPVDGASAAAQLLADAEAAWRRLGAALDAPAPRRDSAALPRPAPLLVADRVVFIPEGGDAPVLRGVSFTLRGGEVLGVIGPSAAGKSTLLGLAIGLAAPTAGALTLDGYATALWDRADLARHVGFMPQHLALHDGTVAQLIARLGQPDMRTVIDSAKRAGLHEAIMRLPCGYATPLAEAGHLLSGGQRARLALARALYGEPCLVVLDEPDAALDAEGEAALVAAVAAARERGAAVLLSSHRRAIIEAADRLLVLNQGLVERHGPREAVVASLGSPPVRLVPVRAGVAREAAG